MERYSNVAKITQLLMAKIVFEPRSAGSKPTTPSSVSNCLQFLNVANQTYTNCIRDNRTDLGVFQLHQFY